ncbi:MAG: EMC3/TMCO1 family protein [Candidatus Woesearchaeota archaeon]
MKTIVIVMGVALLIAGLWNTVPIIKTAVHFVLDPSFGKLLGWHLLGGMVVLVFIINCIQTIIHKYSTDQVGLKKLKEEQKEFKVKMKELKDQPDKMMELQKQQMASLPKSFSMSMKSVAYTSIPLILFIRWFDDYFEVLGDPKVLFVFGWLGSYIVLSVIASMIWKKVLKVH